MFAINGHNFKWPAALPLSVMGLGTYASGYTQERLITLLIKQIRDYLILLSWNVFIRATDSKDLLCTVELSEPCSLCSDKWLCGLRINLSEKVHAWMNLTRLLKFFLYFFYVYFHFYSPEFIHLNTFEKYIKIWITYTPSVEIAAYPQKGMILDIKLKIWFDE